MDFSPDEGQQAVADVVTSVLGRDNSWDALVSNGLDMIWAGVIRSGSQHTARAHRCRPSCPWRSLVQSAHD